MFAAMVRLLALAAALRGVASMQTPRSPAALVADSPRGGGIQEDTKTLACSECQSHAEYLDQDGDCVCFASQIGTFFAHVNATNVTNTTGVQLADPPKHSSFLAVAKRGWVWHCGPV